MRYYKILQSSFVTFQSIFLYLYLFKALIPNLIGFLTSSKYAVLCAESGDKNGRSAWLECALSVSLLMFGALLERCCALLPEPPNSQQHADAFLLLPAIKVNNAFFVHPLFFSLKRTYQTLACGFYPRLLVYKRTPI